ncbi:NAD(P)/FAD-dependent oxidoreductase [Microtetraspora sp. NBRC 16547]|uniref:flavin-containing monooxygenase n=1 Tax=Microtetraspora sp. NBRC 16547 TaxID=3030993 RepID=UPI00255675AB|nr:NAD(P)/FAD-dependent oxidoreductase [Microtetraspora sp. NBRC 16547]
MTRTKHDDDADGVTEVDVLIVGAGFGGIGMGATLARRGRRSFVILERAAEVGGTWWYNTYPGAACDVPSHLYSFSFRLKPDWSRIFATQPEILEYLRETAREEGLLDHISFETEMRQAHWNAAESVWDVDTSAGRYRARTLVSAVGHLSEPRLPSIEGVETFEDTKFHSARWNHDADLEGKQIGIIGSGATAIQVVPELAKVASRLVVFQRSAPYITPRPDRAYTDAEKRMFARLPETMREEREGFFWANEGRYAQRRGTPSLVKAAADVALAHLRRQVDDPEIARKLTPDYTFGCKRVLKSDDYYPTFNRPNVLLETDPIARVTPRGIETASGTEHDLDALVLCTGFEATDLPIAHQIFGVGGVSLSERWSGGMQAYATMAVPEFPNLWIINGPNTGLGHNSAVYVAESQMAYIAEALDYLDESGLDELEVTEAAEETFMQMLEDTARGTVWLDGSCRSWYVDQRNGRLTTLWPDFAHSFRAVNGSFDPRPYQVDQLALP